MNQQVRLDDQPAPAGHRCTVPSAADVAGRAMIDRHHHEMHEAETKAWESLSKYKFAMFGYWCGIWVHLNRIGGCRQSNPWAEIVRFAGKVASQQ